MDEWPHVLCAILHTCVCFLGHCHFNNMGGHIETHRCEPCRGTASWGWGRGRLLVFHFCGPFRKGHVFGFMVGGEEFCLRFGERGGRANVDCFGGLFFATSSTSRVRILQKSQEHDAIDADKRLTSELTGVFDAGSCRSFSRCFCTCWWCFSKCSNLFLFWAMDRSNLLKKWACVLAVSCFMIDSDTFLDTVCMDDEEFAPRITNTKPADPSAWYRSRHQCRLQRSTH